jgi:hypothetical protein
MGITVKFLSFRHLTFQEWRWLLEGWIYLYTSRINWQREKSSLQKVQEKDFIHSFVKQVVIEGIMSLQE